MVLATEEEIYKKDSACLAVEIIELIFLVSFLIEITISVIAFGPKNVFSYYINFVLILTIVTLLTWTLLDTIDNDEFRELGAFRFLRVLMIVFKFNETRFIMELRLTNIFTNISTPVHVQINQIL